MINRVSVKDVNGISLILGVFFSLIPFIIQLFLYDTPKDLMDALAYSMRYHLYWEPLSQRMDFLVYSMILKKINLKH